MNNENEALKRQLDALKEELNIYEKFISHHNLENKLDDFICNMDSLNKDEHNLYWYELRLRPFSIGCQPKGHIEVNHNLGRWGIVAYKEPLNESDLYNYDLSPYNFK